MSLPALSIAKLSRPALIFRPWQRPHISEFAEPWHPGRDFKFQIQGVDQNPGRDIPGSKPVPFRLLRPQTPGISIGITPLRLPCGNTDPAIGSRPVFAKDRFFKCTLAAMVSQIEKASGAGPIAPSTAKKPWAHIRSHERATHGFYFGRALSDDGEAPASFTF